MRTFALALLLAFGVALAAPVAYAAGGTVTFSQRNYAVQIEANGDVRVVEHWQVQFSGSSFHTAFLELYTAHTSGIDYGTVAGATPGSQHTSQTTDGAGNALTEVAWDFTPAQDTTRTFDIPYTIHGALQVGTTQAWLDWTYLDDHATGGFTVNSSQVTVTLPGATPNTAPQVQATDPDATPTTSVASGTTAQASVQNVTSTDPFEVEVAFPRTLLAASVQRPSWQTSDTPPTLQQPQSAPTNGGFYTNPGGGLFPGLSTLCGCGFIPLIIIGLIIFSLFRSFFGFGPRGGFLGRRWYGPWGGMWGPWYGGGPWNHPGGPWGGGGFGGGGFGGGMGGGGGFGGGGGAGGGGGGGGAGFG